MKIRINKNKTEATTQAEKKEKDWGKQHIFFLIYVNKGSDLQDFLRTRYFAFFGFLGLVDVSAQS